MIYLKQLTFFHNKVIFSYIKLIEDNCERCKPIINKKNLRLKEKIKALKKENVALIAINNDLNIKIDKLQK